MIRVVVRFMGRVSRLVKCRELALELPEESILADLLHAVVLEYGGRLADQIYEDSEHQRLSKAHLFLVDGKEARHRAGLQTVLQEGTIVIIMPMSVGG